MVFIKNNKFIKQQIKIKTKPINIVMCFFGMLAIVEYILGLFSRSETLTFFYLVQLLLSFGLSVITSVRKLGLYHLFTLLHITIFVFAFGGIVVSPLVETANFRISYSPIYIHFPEEVVQKSILIYIIYITVSFLFFFYIYNKKSSRRRRIINIPQYNKKYFKIGRFLMITMLPWAFLYAYLLYSTFSLNRTTMYINGGTEVPLYLRLTNLFFVIGYYFIIASVPPRNKFIKYSLIYLATLVPILMMGERGDVVVPIIFIIWYLNKMYGIKVNLSKVVLIAVAIMVISYILTFTRLGEDVNSITFSVLILGFFATSATSFRLLSYYVMFKDQVMEHTYPFVLDSLIGGLTGQYGQSLETLEVRSSIGHQLVYTLNPEYYLSGASMGTSFVAEGFEFGLIGVIIVSSLLSIMVNFVETKMTKGFIKLFLLYYFFQIIILSPRGAILPGIYDIIKYLGCSFIILKTYELIFVKRGNDLKHK